MLVNIETVTVGDTGHASDAGTGYGAVAHLFALDKHGVTISQYSTFPSSAGDGLWPVLAATR
jgi:hypothetical protein